MGIFKKTQCLNGSVYTLVSRGYCSAFMDNHIDLLLGFPNSSVGKESASNVENTGDLGSIPGWGRSPEGRNGNPLQCSPLKNPTDRKAWQSSVQRLGKNQT